MGRSAIQFSDPRPMIRLDANSETLRTLCQTNGISQRPWFQDNPSDPKF
jgi:hypothetical protein